MALFYLNDHKIKNNNNYYYYIVNERTCALCAFTNTTVQTHSGCSHSHINRYAKV